MAKSKTAAASFNQSPTTDHNFCLARVPEQVLKSLATLDLTGAALVESPLNVARTLSTRGRTSHVTVVRFMEGEAIQTVASSSFGSARFAIQLLLECALFYHSVGHGVHAIDLLKMVLLEAYRIADTNLQRRAHNILGGFYATRCEFHLSCKHLHESLTFAKELHNPVYILAALANTVAALETMGFLRDARELALKLITQPDGTPELDYLHLANANNAIRICHALNDEASADIFYKISSDKVGANNPVISNVTRAYFESARATHLIAKGRPDIALTYINKALEASPPAGSMRATAVLYCAQALAHIALHDKRQVENSKVTLARLLSQTSDSTDLQEELLRALIKLNLIQTTKSGKRDTLRYLHALREHVIAVKFRHYFLDALRSAYNSKDEQWETRVPSYIIPDWIAQAAYDADGDADGIADESAISNQLTAIEDGIAALTKARYEPRLRTTHFRLAEAWAVATEYAAEGSGSHCFRVGKLAALIAARLGWAEKRCVTLELACRLHDIGKATLVDTVIKRRGLRSSGDYGIVYQHTTLGERLLSTSSDETLQLAAKIAKSHHEWWNGCGFPSGLKGASIAVEGRICAVADAFVTLLDPPVGQVPWSTDRALEQLGCMSGVQLDPDVVRVLAGVFLPHTKTIGPLGIRTGEVVDTVGGVKAKREFYVVLEFIG